MAIQLSTTLRNAQADAVESTIGTSPKLQIRTGAPPANCAAADSGTLLAELTLPSDWLNAAASGAKTLLGSWTGAGGAGAGAGLDGGHFRIKDSTGTTTHMQGTFGETADSPDMVADNKNIANGQTVTITAFTYTRNNA